MTGRNLLERVARIYRIRWPAFFGAAGRFAPEYADVRHGTMLTINVNVRKDTLYMNRLDVLMAFPIFCQ